uniref:Kazal-like domain-containing protein n=1 Tax=Biomphalaria glabrata TaxID=6526 RepID=A0A2C9L6T9_BIOGL
MFYFTLCLIGFIIASAVQDISGQETSPPCNMMCPFIYLPVCASNGLTYASRCVMESMSCIDSLGLTLRHEGPCV